MQQPLHFLVSHQMHLNVSKEWRLWMMFWLAMWYLHWLFFDTNSFWRCFFTCMWACCWFYQRISQITKNEPFSRSYVIFLTISMDTTVTEALKLWSLEASCPIPMLKKHSQDTWKVPNIYYTFGDLLCNSATSEDKTRFLAVSSSESLSCPLFPSTWNSQMNLSESQLLFDWVV